MRAQLRSRQVWGLIVALAGASCWLVACAGSPSSDPEHASSASSQDIGARAAPAAHVELCQNEWRYLAPLVRFGKGTTEAYGLGPDETALPPGEALEIFLDDVMMYLDRLRSMGVVFKIKAAGYAFREENPEELSLARANKVLDALVERGISREMTVAEGRGDQGPLGGSSIGEPWDVRRVRLSVYRQYRPCKTPEGEILQPGPAKSAGTKRPRPLPEQ